MHHSQYNAASRRHFLATGAMGLGGLALSWLLNEENALAAPMKPPLEDQAFDLKPKAPHAEPQARAMISLFMQGGPSHIDLFDPKRLGEQHFDGSGQGQFLMPSIEDVTGKPDQKPE